MERKKINISYYLVLAFTFLDINPKSYYLYYLCYYWYTTGL